MNKAKLSAADPRFHHSVVPEAAYVAAAIAAFHPEPHAQAEFLGSQGLMHRVKVASELLCLENGRLLSVEILKLHIFGVSSAVMFHKQPELPKKVTKLYYAHVSECSGMFWGQHERVRRMVSMSSYLAQSSAQTLFEPTIRGLLTYIGTLISIFWLLAKRACNALLC